MSPGIDIRYVRENYERMPDDELFRIVTLDAAGLTPEALEVVEEEIKKRGLGEDIKRGLEIQSKPITITELNEYCDILSILPCPICGKSTKKLNATLTVEVVSFFLFCNSTQIVKIGCPDCLDKANNSALLKSALLGWWHLPSGLIKTLDAISINMKSMRTNHAQTHSSYFLGFAKSKIGELETYRNNKEKLWKIISRQNNF